MADSVVISHEHKCIFIHIPKCAGTTVESALGHFDGYEGRGGQDHRTIRMIEPVSVLPLLNGHRNRMELLRRIHHRLHHTPNGKGHLTVSPRQYREYFKFTIVRNPWSRAVSVYRNVMADDIHRQKYGVAADTSFREFLHRNAGKGMLRPQLDWIVDWHGGIPMDFIGRFEELERDFPKISSHLDSVTLEFDPTGPQAPVSSWFDDELNRIIENVYRREIELFGFSLDQLGSAAFRGGTPTTQPV